MCCFWSTLILALFAVFVFLNLLVVILTYSMCWYEYANTDPKLIDNRFRRRPLRMVLSLFIRKHFSTF